MYDTIFGEGAIGKLKKEDMAEYLTIMRDFEAKKRTVKANQGSHFVTRLSAVFNEMITNDVKMERIQSSYLKDQISVNADKLKLSPNLMESFFRDSIEKIVKQIHTIFKSIEDVQMILLVGGYGESPLLQETFKKEFANMIIVTPQDCNLVVMKGAVLYGHNPMTISARILRFSYGLSVEDEFDPKIHPQENRYYDKYGVARCRQYFSKLIEKNTKVPSTGKTVTTFMAPVYDTQRSTASQVYCTEKDDPLVVDESCQLVGTLNVTVPEHVKGKWDTTETYVFGMTEIKIAAKVTATDETFETTLNLLE